MAVLDKRGAEICIIFLVNLWCLRYNYNASKFDYFAEQEILFRQTRELTKDMMGTILTAIKLLGGLAMFLYGMEIMGDGLKQGSGTALKNFLGKLTQNALMGVITGTLVTAIIQSSTATIVLTVGLIGAGILNLRQAVSIVLGANIGTTVTAQIIRLMDIESSGDSLLAFFKPDTLAPLALCIGVTLFMLVQKNGSKKVGMLCVGIGVLFSGVM